MAADSRDVVVVDPRHPDVVYTFKHVREQNYVGKRVRCPICARTMDSRAAKRHFGLVHSREQPAADDARDLQLVDGVPGETVSASDSDDKNLGRKRRANQQQETALHRRRRIPTEDQDADLLRQLCGVLPIELVSPTVKLLGLQPFKLQSSSDANINSRLFLNIQTSSILQSVLPPEFSLTRMVMDRDTTPPMDNDLTTTHHELNGHHLTAIESGGTIGLERLAGAVLVTGNHRLKILCVEVYNRDEHTDPHAEPVAAFPSSLPDTSSTVQYSGRLKIITLCDNFGSHRLVIGVRRYNYLVTSGDDNQVRVGPSRSGSFVATPQTRLYIRQEKQDCTALDGDILGLAQVRSNFGHPATYTTRRAGLVGYTSFNQMPVTVFTLSQWNIPHARVFYQLWKRSQEAGGAVKLRLEDIEDAPNGDNRTSAKLSRDLRRLFATENVLNISNNKDAEAVLTQLADSLSSSISDKNRVVATRMVSLG